MDFSKFIFGLIIGAFLMLVVDGYLNARKADKENKDIEIWHHYFIAYTVYEKGDLVNPITRGNAYVNCPFKRKYQDIDEIMWDYIIEKGSASHNVISKENHYIQFESINYMGQGEKCTLVDS